MQFHCIYPSHTVCFGMINLDLADYLTMLMPLIV